MQTPLAPTPTRPTPADLDPASPAGWDATGVPIARLNAEGVAVQANAAFAALAQRAANGWPNGLEAASRQRLADALRERAASTGALRLLARSPASTTLEDQWWSANLRWAPDETTCVCVLHEVSDLKRIERAALEQTAHLRLLANNVPVLIAHYRTTDFRCLYANRLYARTFGFDETTVLGRTFAEVIGEEAARQIWPSVNRVLETRQTVSYERQIVAADGSMRWLEVNLVPELGAGGEVASAFVLISDITRHRMAEAAMRESEERLAKFMQASVEGIVFHVGGVITDANPAMCQLLGYSLDELLGHNSLDFIAPEHRERVGAIVGAGVELTYEGMVIHRDGLRIPVEFIGRTLVRNGVSTRMSIVRDIRDRHAAQARINYLAHHDALTGLPNRSAFMEHLNQAMAIARGTQAELGLLFIDLDHFKRVNDSLGHLVGDALLQTVARRILECVRATDRVARFGGDEFMVLLADVRARADIEQVAHKLLAAIEVPFQAEGRPLTVTPSVGIAVFPHDASTADELIKHADTAMYVAKARGRATYQFFDPANADSAYADLVLEGELAHAIEREEFMLVFQPQVRAADGALVAVEALIRWRHPDRGLLTPDDFIALAEERRLMLPIGQWVLREAARSARHWRTHGLPHLPVAVNLSTMQFQAPDFVDSIAQVLRDEEVPGQWLELELTERMLMADLPAVRRTLGQLKAMGIRLSVDDFGTGYSSLGHLKNLPIDKMKIDRSFVMGLPAERDSAAIATAIIQMARSLELTVVAEGVETEAQRQFLAERGCHGLQGAAISAPLSCEELQAWAAGHTVS
jgi:diguanylate cyclase (GGDEF)-like protein/PAS domain S-box-containing protein